MSAALQQLSVEKPTADGFPAFTMAFQPIVDVDSGEVFAHEALVRPAGGGTAADILGQMNDQNRYEFDQLCRVRAIELAAQLEMRTFLSINFLPSAIYEAESCLEKTFAAARHVNFPCARLICEVTENEPTRDIQHFNEIFTAHKHHGMVTAIDDFGAGHSGLNMLADFQPDIIKIDMALTRNIHSDKVRRSIARAIMSLCTDLQITVIAEGVETVEEAVTLRSLGVALFQGYLFAKPSMERLPAVSVDALRAVRAKHESALGKRRIAGAGRWDAKSRTAKAVRRDDQFG